MANNRFYKLDKEKQELILTTALREFMDKNFDAASINQISKKAGLSAGALYYYFEDKEDLFNTTIEYSSAGMRINPEELELLFKEYGYWEGITEIVRRRFEFTLLHPEKMRFIQRLILTKDAAELGSQNKVLNTFKMIFNYGYDNGFINNSLPRELMFELHLGMTTSINKWGLEYSSTEKQIEHEKDLAKKYVDMIRKAIGVE